MNRKAFADRVFRPPQVLRLSAVVMESLVELLRRQSWGRSERRLEKPPNMGESSSGVGIRRPEVAAEVATFQRATE